MEEKVIIKSRQAPIIKLISLVIFVIGFVIGLSASINYSTPFEFDSYFLTSILPYCMSIWFLPFAVVAVVLYFSAAKTELTVTDKRVYGKAIFGKRVDLPVDLISAVGTSFLMGVSVSTSSGSIHFLGVQNKDDIHSEISKLLMLRQEKKTDSANVAAAPQSSADELKKYKELLESGAITQEEFDAKKKQLLGL